MVIREHNWDHFGRNKTPLDGLIERDIKMIGTNNPPQIVLFNGPPRSGKDAAAQILGELLAAAGVIYNIYSFARPLKLATHALFGVNAYEKHYDTNKDSPAGEFMGFTPREAYIKVSEDAVKPAFGNDFFAKVAVNSIYKMNCNVVVTDCGFQEEVDLLVKAMSERNVHLVKMYRKDTSFDKDSRGYVKHVYQTSVMNNGTLQDLRYEMIDLMTHIGDFK